MEIWTQSHHLPSPSRKLHHRSPSPDTVSDSKRQKHHRHRRHRHRHRSQMDKKEDDFVDAVNQIKIEQNRVAEDGEIEEGEIVEEEEIVSDRDNENLVVPEKNQIYTYKEAEALDNHLDSLTLESPTKDCELPNKKINSVPRFSDADKADEKIPVYMAKLDLSYSAHTEIKQSINKDADGDNEDLINRLRTVSPYPRGSIYPASCNSIEDDNKFSAYPSRGRDKNIECNQRDQSRSREIHAKRNHVSNVDRDKHKQRKCHDKEGDRIDHGRLDKKDRCVHSDRLDSERSASHITHYERGSFHTDNDWERDKMGKHNNVRERSSSISGRQGHDIRKIERDTIGHGNCEKPTDVSRDMYRERESSEGTGRDIYKYDRHMGCNRDHDRENDKCTVRDTDNNRVTQKVYQHPRHGDWEKHRDRMRSKEISYDTHATLNIEKPKDAGRDRYREIESRDVIAKDRYRYDRHRGHNRDRENDDRYNVRGTGNNREKQNNYQHLKHDDREKHRDRMKPKEIFYNTHDTLGKNRESLREEDEDNYQERIEQQLANQEEDELEKIKEESRKRREAILKKYKQQPLQNKLAVSPVDEESMQKDTKNNSSDVKQDSSDVKQDSPNSYAVHPSFTVEKSPMGSVASTLVRGGGVGGLGEGSPKSERSTDIFCDDIFGESPVGSRKRGRVDALQVEQSGLHDNWDDAEGYYCYRLGEVLDGRYEVIAAHGKGVFSTVVRAKDLKAAIGQPNEVAIKIIRNNETMYKAGQEELKILGKLAAADPEDKRRCVRFLSTFKFRNHLCLVFESLHMNLREVLKKFGRNIGLKLTAVRAYAKQLFIALKHLRNCGVLHCDIKPDNMLVNEGKNILKLCDFGNAMPTGKNEPTPYLVSRFYRAPEIILGLEYDHPMDMWSVGCCLYELYCGKVLFPGPSNNDMLRLHMELKGSFPRKILRKGLFTNTHFDQDFGFLATEEDPVTRKPTKRLLSNIKPKDIGTLISSSPGDDPKMIAHFKDLLEKMFVLDPEKRLTVSQALSHPFITGK